MDAIACPSCGEEDRLQGARIGEIIYISCEACGDRWRRDLKRRCAYCGSENLRYTPVTLWSAGRGTMRTPAGEQEAWACIACGASDCTKKK